MNATELLNQYDKQCLLSCRSLEDRLITYDEVKKHCIGIENGNKLKGIVGSVNNGLYPTFEDKIAHLFYFIIKDHPFVDGNKRSACLVLEHYVPWKVNQSLLATTALLVAHSMPDDKDIIIELIINNIYD